MTTLPAVVRVIDLPTGTTITGLEVFEAVQTVGGVQISVQVPINQVMTSTLGGLPTGGGTSQILAKSSGGNYSTAWYDVTTFISVNTTTGLATSGTGTALVVSISSGGIGSTQLGANAVQRANITAQAIGSAQLDTAAVLRANVTSFAIGSAQIDISAVLRANLTAFAIGSAQVDTSAILRANLTAFAIGSAQIDTSAILRANLTAFLIGSAQLDTGSINIASAIVTGILPVATLATTSPPLGFNVPVNLALSASTSGNALTINVLGNNGAAPSATNPVLIPFRNASIANGVPNWVLVTAAMSCVITQTATIGAVSGNPMRGWITAHDTGTAPVLGVINCVVGMPNPSRIVQLAPQSLVTAVAISSAAITAGNFYASGAANNRPFSILGYFDYTNMTTAGQWINTPDHLQLFGPGIKKPGDPVQFVYVTNNATGSTTGTAFVVSNLSASIVLVDMQNVVEIMANGHGVTTTTTQLYSALRRNGVASNLGSINTVGVGSGGVNSYPMNHFAIVAPATTVSVTYGIEFASAQTGNQVNFPSSSFGTPISAISIKELMG